MSSNNKHIIIIGAGFGGLYSAKELLRGNSNFKITIIDTRNFHLFQPLLYQVATAQLAPEDIAYPIRSIFAKNKNVSVLKEKVTKVDLEDKSVTVECGKLSFDKLIISVGVIPEYFGNDNWQDIAPPLKTLEDALKIRRKILNVFERAESEMLHPCDENPLNFVIIGGGPTGIELSGALAELSRNTLKNEFRSIKPERAKIFLIEAGKSILTGFPQKLQLAAKKSMEELGIIIKLNSKVTKIDKTSVKIENNGTSEIIESKVVLWAAGVKGNFAKSFLSNENNIKFDKKGRVIVNRNLTIPNYEDIYVIGDFASFSDEKNIPLPGTAPVAMQEGTFVAKNIKGESEKDFKYYNKGSLTVIGRNAAVADFGKFQISGFFAWILWVVVHIGYLIGFNNRILVLVKWGWSYFIRKSTSRIIYRSTNHNSKN